MTRKLRKDVWTTYRMRAYSHAITQDQQSAGGVIYSQVRCTRRTGWQIRQVQSNGRYSSEALPLDVSDAEGEEAWKMAQTY